MCLTLGQNYLLKYNTVLLLLDFIILKLNVSKVSSLILQL